MFFNLIGPLYICYGFSFLFLWDFSVCVFVCAHVSAHVCMCIYSHACLQRPEDSLKSPTAGVVSGYEVGTWVGDQILVL